MENSVVTYWVPGKWFQVQIVHSTTKSADVYDRGLQEIKGDACQGVRNRVRT